MSQKSKFKRDHTKDVSPVLIIEGLLAKGMYADALHQSKKLVHEAPTVVHWTLLRKVYLTYVQNLSDRENFAIAHPVLTEMENLPGNDAEWLEKIAVFRANLGDWTSAMKILVKVPDAEAPKRVMGAIADRALRQGAQGRKNLPPDLQAGFDLIMSAVQQYELNRDDQARETLQGIGTQSPYLEWKLMIRGLMAYSTNDDARALENWQRLSGSRLPAQLIASLRYAIDPTFREVQPQQVATRLQRQVDSLTGGALTGLRQIQRHLATEHGLPEGLRLAQTIVPELKHSEPKLVEKLANYFYWMIYTGGEPDDLKPYRRAFGSPVDDPDFARLEGLVMDKLGNFATANKHWQVYEKWIANHPERWPGEQGNRARAILWQHMGENAMNHLEAPTPDDNDFLSLLEFFNARMAPKKPVPLKPTGEECFRHAWDLAPNWEKPAACLFNVLVETDQVAKAEKLSTQLLEQFPNQIEVLASVAMLHEKQGNPGVALECFKKAMHANPLDRGLRGGVSVMSYRYGRDLAIEGEADQARAAFQEALDMDPGGFHTAIRCLWAACEFKWKNLDRAKQLLVEAQSDPSLHLVIAYRVIVEGGRLKVPKPILAPYLKEFADALEGHPPAAEVFPLASAVEAYRIEPIPYRGLQTHEKKIASLVQKLITNNPTEAELEKFGMTLLRLKSWRFLKTCADQGKRRFPKNPYFHYFLGEHELNKKNFREYAVAGNFNKALKLMEGATDDKYRPLREAIDRARQEHPAIETFMQGDRFPFGFE